jgi:hypothetical protein
MIKVYKYKYASSVVPNIDAAVNGLLPFDVTQQGLTGCVCDGKSVFLFFCNIAYFI